MSKFKVGDEVIRIKNVAGNLPVGIECIVDGCDSHLLSVVGYEGLFCEDNFELVKSKYPNPPHKHADLIIEWTKGAIIECWQPYGGVWLVIDKPKWAENCIYRVAPTPAELAGIETQAKIDKLLAKVDKLKLTLRGK